MSVQISLTSGCKDNTKRAQCQEIVKNCQLCVEHNDEGVLKQTKLPDNDYPAVLMGVFFAR